MKPRFHSTCRATWWAAAALALAACDNMGHQRGAGDVARDRGETPAELRAAPAHTVARDDGPPAGMPDPITPALLARGRDRFDIFCAICHGADGYGQGIVVKRGFPAPPSLHDADQRRRSNEQIYAAISRGAGRMLPLADRLVPADRWAVVAYVRALQLSQHAVLGDLPEADRRHFQSP